MKTRIFTAKCEVCGKGLKDNRSIRCGPHVDKSYCKGRATWSKGKTWKLNETPEQKERRRLNSLGRRMSLEAREKIRLWHIENRGKQVKKDTGIELAIEAELTKRGLTFIKQHPLFGISIVDFFLPEYNLVIQCDGCYWHNCPSHYPQHNKNQSLKDATKDNALRNRGLTVYRFWEHEINESASNCLFKIGLP